MTLRGMALAVKKVLIPPKLFWVQKFQKRKSLRILDVGCGNASFKVTRKWLNVGEYHGVDREYWRGEKGDYEGLDRFFKVDLDHDNLSEIPDDFYDVIIFSHVIEHLWKGHETLRALGRKLREDGVIYVETPSERTLRYPSAEGFLNFYDDPTHTKPYPFPEISKTLSEEGLAILKQGVRRDWKRILLLAPPAILYNLFYQLPFKRKLLAAGLWDLLGVAVFVVAQKKNSNYKSSSSPQNNQESFVKMSKN
jgi:SAM-dependent methyltransferase